MAKVTMVFRDVPSGGVSIEVKSRPPVREGIPLTPAQAIVVRVHQGVTGFVAANKERNESKPSSEIGTGTPLEPRVD